jgi:hypothetical protein
MSMAVDRGPGRRTDVVFRPSNSIWYGTGKYL